MPPSVPTPPFSSAASNAGRCRFSDMPRRRSSRSTSAGIGDLAAQQLVVHGDVVDLGVDAGLRGAHQVRGRLDLPEPRVLRDRHPGAVQVPHQEVDVLLLRAQDVGVRLHGAELVDDRLVGGVRRVLAVLRGQRLQRDVDLGLAGRHLAGRRLLAARRLRRPASPAGCLRRRRRTTRGGGCAAVVDRRGAGAHRQDDDRGQDQSRATHRDLLLGAGHTPSCSPAVIVARSVGVRERITRMPAARAAGP